MYVELPFWHEHHEHLNSTSDRLQWYDILYSQFSYLQGTITYPSWGNFGFKHRLNSASCEKDVSFEECFLQTFFRWKLKLLPWKLRVIPWKSRKLVQMYSLLKACPFKKGTFLRSFSGPWGWWMSPRWSDVWRIIVLLLVKKRGVDAILELLWYSLLFGELLWYSLVEMFFFKAVSQQFDAITSFKVSF